MTIVAAIVCLVALNKLGIVHTRQILNYGEDIADFLLSNESPLELKDKLDKFHREINEETNSMNKSDIDIPKDLMYGDIGILSEYESLQKDIYKFIDVLEDESSLAPLDKDRMKRDIGTKIGYIMYNAYLTVNDAYYKGKNYRSCVESQKELLNEIHSFIYLDMGNNSYQDDEMNRLLDKTVKLNEKLNIYLVEEIGDMDVADNVEPFDINGLGIGEDNKFKKSDLSNNLYF